jgi:hypothetical protein
MKRYIAGSYANTSIMHSEVVDGIQERVRALLRRCEEADKSAIDFYVSIAIAFPVTAKLTGLGLSALFCHGLCLVSSGPSPWNQVN